MRKLFLSRSLKNKRKIIERSGLFDSTWYIQNYSDMSDIDDPILHYLLNGVKYKRQPSPYFDAVKYLEMYPDIKKSGVNPLIHWILHGQKEGRKYPYVENSLLSEFYHTQKTYEDGARRKLIASGLFDEKWYKRNNPDIGSYDPALHYIRHGYLESRNPSAYFDGNRYIRDNPDVGSARVNPLIHWIEHGRFEGRKSPLKGDHAPKPRTIYEFCDPYAKEFVTPAHDENFKISVLTPTYNTEPRYLRELFNSLRNQTYGNWEWSICDDCSGSVETLEELRRITGEDSRVILKKMRKSEGISGATNVALNSATGNYCALVDHDDLLARTIFEKIHEKWIRNPDCELFYTDECKLSIDGTLYDFAHKPAWSPTLLENTMYIGHLSVYKTSILRSASGFRSSFDGTQDFDLALRLSNRLKQVEHIPSVGYLWRAIEGSTALALSEKSYALVLQKRALEEYASAKGNASVEAGASLGMWRINYALAAQPPLLSVIIPTGAGRRKIRGRNVDLLTNCIRSLVVNKFYPNMEFIVVHNGNISTEHVEFFREVVNVKLVHYEDEVFNLSRKLNIGVNVASGKYICLMNDDIEAIDGFSADGLVSFLETHPEVGAIAPMCLYEDGSVQHNGIVMLEDGPSHAGIGREPTFPGPSHTLLLRREVFGVSGALLIASKVNYQLVGGFNESLPLNYNDVEFCGKLRSIGLSCVVDPAVKVYHFESATKSGTFKCEKEMLFRALPAIEDPYFNPNFRQSSPWFEDHYDGSHSLPEISFERLHDERVRKRIQHIDDTSLKFTLGVSVYNQTKSQLVEMFASLTSQTYPNTEVIIYDDGSTKRETLEWLASIRHHPSVRFYQSKANLGIMCGQRRLLEEARGDYFLPVDADDFISIDCVETMAMAAIANPDVYVFYSNEYKTDRDSKKFAPFYKTDFDHIKILNCCYTSHQMMFRTEFLRKIGGYSDDRATWCHDWDSTLRAVTARAAIMHVPELLYAWRISPGSTASVETSEKPDALKSQEFILQRFLKEHSLDHVLVAEQNRLGTRTGMWTLTALKPVENVTTVQFDEVWNGSVEQSAEALLRGWNSIGESGWTLIVMPDTNVSEAKILLSAPAHVDSNIKVVGSILVDEQGRVVWSGGTIQDASVQDPSQGLRAVDGGYHGELYCQRLVDVVAGANVMIRNDVVAEAVEQLGGQLDPGTLMIQLGLLSKEHNWFVAITPRLRTTLPPGMNYLIPLDRTGLCEYSKAGSAPSRWGQHGLLPVFRTPS